MIVIQRQWHLNAQTIVVRRFANRRCWPPIASFSGNFKSPAILADLIAWLNKQQPEVIAGDAWLMARYPEIVEELTRIALEDKPK